MLALQLLQVEVHWMNCFTAGEQHGLLFQRCTKASGRNILNLLARLTGSCRSLGVEGLWCDCLLALLQ